MSVRLYITGFMECPECHELTLECRYWDSGGDSSYNFFDNFLHICMHPNCSFIEERLAQYGGQSPYEDPYPDCPFCKRNAVEGIAVMVENYDCIKNKTPLAQST